MLAYVVGGSLLVFAAAAAAGRCDPGFIAEQLDYTPDAWKLIKEPNLKFYLMFVSQGGVPPDYRCLRTYKTEDVKGRIWEKRLMYHAYPNNTTVKIWYSTLGITKNADSCVYENTVTATNSRGDKKPEWRSQVLYTDYHSCILLKSKVLDCLTLVYLNATKTLKPQIAVWFDMLLEYAFNVRHGSGSKIEHVDAINRIGVEDPSYPSDNVIADKLDICLTMSL
ncbi:hypothetical protein V5799_027012 [Amblyomma americanum]|uniref:Secreted protein n=1 Tax=Amblyomma americanum TaxID=6943 RepID=A0AAQ4DGY3_AMBAM